MSIHFIIILLILVSLTAGCFKENKESHGIIFYLLFDEDFEMNATYDEIKLFIDSELVYSCNKSYYPFDSVTPHGKFETNLNSGEYKILISYHNETINGEKIIFVDKKLYVQSRLINNTSVEIKLLNGPMNLK